MSRLGIATVFEDIPDGYEFNELNTPLHLTHVDVCEVDFEPTEFVSKLREHLSNSASFYVTPIEDTFFGPNKDIPVTLIDLNPDLKAFHEQIMGFLQSHSAVLDNPQFHNERYSPHISIYGQRRVPLGQPITIKSVSIGNKQTDIENPSNRIIATIQLA